MTCDEDEYQVALGTQVMCTYTDESGDRPINVEVTAVKGSQFRVTVTVQRRAIRAASITDLACVR